MKLAISFVFVLTLCVNSPAIFAFKLSTQGTALEQSVAKKYSNWWRRVATRLSDKGFPLFAKRRCVAVSTRGDDSHRFGRRDNRDTAECLERE